MTYNERLNEISTRIEEYSYTTSPIYLYPLNEELCLLRKYFNYQSKDDAFNYYINTILLPGIDTYIDICENKKGLRPVEDDIKSIKEGVLFWDSLFKVACKHYSVNILEEQII